MVKLYGIEVRVKANLYLKAFKIKEHSVIRSKKYR